MRLLLIDIGNTHTHLGLANQRRVTAQVDLPTAGWANGGATPALHRFVGRQPLDGVAICSVVPRCTPLVRQAVSRTWDLACLELTAQTVQGVGIK